MLDFDFIERGESVSRGSYQKTRFSNHTLSGCIFYYTNLKCYTMICFQEVYALTVINVVQPVDVYIEAIQHLLHTKICTNPVASKLSNFHQTK